MESSAISREKFQSLFYMTRSSWLTALFLCSIALTIFGMLSGSNEPILAFLRNTAVEEVAVRLHHGNQVIFGISVGYLTGVMVWVFVVWLPEKNRRRIVRTNLHRRYREFKRANLQTLFHAAGRSVDSTAMSSLCDDHREFRATFDSNEKALWYAAMNGIADETKPYLDDILVEYQILAGEFSYASNTILIHDDELHSFLRRMLEIVHRLSNYNSDRYNLEKLIGQYLFEIFARWSFIDGQRETDFVEDMIDRI